MKPKSKVGMARSHVFYRQKQSSRVSKPTRSAESLWNKYDISRKVARGTSQLSQAFAQSAEKGEDT